MTKVLCFFHVLASKRVFTLALVGNLYNLTDVLSPMMPVYQQLIKSGAKLNILVYSGDDDAVCATLGSQQ